MVSLSRSKSPKEKQAASWKFLKWLTDTPQTSKWAQGTGYMPLRFIRDERCYPDEILYRSAEFPGGGFTDGRTSSAFPCIKLNPKTESTLDKLWERIFVGKEPIKTVADDVAKQVQDLLK